MAMSVASSSNLHTWKDVPIFDFQGPLAQAHLQTNTLCNEDMAQNPLNIGNISSLWPHAWPSSPHN